MCFMQAGSSTRFTAQVPQHVFYSTVDREGPPPTRHSLQPGRQVGCPPSATDRVLQPGTRFTSTFLSFIPVTRFTWDLGLASQVKWTHFTFLPPSHHCQAPATQITNFPTTRREHSAASMLPTPFMSVKATSSATRGEASRPVYH